MYAPKGIGALYVAAGVALRPLVAGGGQERGMRAGTENVALAVALGTAADLARPAQPTDAPEALARLRDLLEPRLAARLPGRVTLNGHRERRLPQTLNVCIAGLRGHGSAAVPGVTASTGSASHAGEDAPSPVLVAMGLGPERAMAAVRLSLGRWTTAEDVWRPRTCWPGRGPVTDLSPPGPARRPGRGRSSPKWDRSCCSTARAGRCRGRAAGAARVSAPRVGQTDEICARPCHRSRSCSGPAFHRASSTSSPEKGGPPRPVTRAAASVSSGGSGSSETGSTPASPYGRGRPRASRGRACRARPAGRVAVVAHPVTVVRGRVAPSVLAVGGSPLAAR